MDFEVSDLGFEVHQHHQSFTIHSPSISRGQITKSPWPNVFFATVLFSKPPSVAGGTHPAMSSRVFSWWFQHYEQHTLLLGINTLLLPIFWNETNTYMSNETPIWPKQMMNVQIPVSMSIHWWLNHYSIFSAVWFPTFEAQKKRDLDDVISNHSPGGNPIQINQTLFSLLKCSWSNLWNLCFFRRNLFSLLLTVSISMWVFLEMGVPPNHPFQWDFPLQTIHLGVPPWLWKPPCVLKTPSKISIGRPSSSHATRMQQGRAPLGLLSYNHLPSGKSNVAMENHLYIEALMEYTLSGWWLGHPSEKYERQLGWLFPIYGKIKHVPNHQPALYIRGIVRCYVWFPEGNSSCFNTTNPPVAVMW